jgi:predicted GNAT superfamily acetyltransferase
MSIAIRDLTTLDEFQQVRQIQQRCWGFAHGEGLYAPLLIAAARNGGMVLGAFDSEQMIGFLFGFLGMNPDRRLKLCSQTMGVLPDYRNRGVAARLKWAQRERMLAVGIDLITWTFDPLEAPNARLNLHTLGAAVSSYDRNLFGEDFGELGRGLPSDRFQASWWISSPRVNSLAAGETVQPEQLAGPQANRCDGDGLRRRIVHTDLTLASPVVHVEIPVDIQTVKRADLALALDWRVQTRLVFEAYLARGYVATDLLRLAAPGGWQAIYRLEKDSRRYDERVLGFAGYGL